jgi:hypothetical protein
MLVQQNLIVVSCFLWSHFLFVKIPSEKVLTEWTFLCKRQSYKRQTYHQGLYLVSCFCFVSPSKLTINQLTWTIPITRLGSLVAQHSCALTRRLLLEYTDSWTQLHCELHFGVLKGRFLQSMIGVQQ